MTELDPQKLKQLADMAHRGELDRLAQRLADQKPGLPAQRFDRQGGRPGDHADPTGNAKPAHAGDYIAYSKAARAIMTSIAVIERLARDNDPNSNNRPSLWKACRHGFIHQPDIDGHRCTARGCTKPWPCNPAETESWWEPCTGTINPTSSECTRCEGLGRSWTCRDCGDVFTDGIDGPSRNERCEKDDKRIRRAAEREDAA